MLWDFGSANKTNYDVVCEIQVREYVDEKETVINVFLLHSER